MGEGLRRLNAVVVPAAQVKARWYGHCWWRRATVRWLRRATVRRVQLAELQKMYSMHSGATRPPEYPEYGNPLPNPNPRNELQKLSWVATVVKPTFKTVA